MEIAHSPWAGGILASLRHLSKRPGISAAGLVCKALTAARAGAAGGGEGRGGKGGRVLRGRVTCWVRWCQKKIGPGPANMPQGSRNGPPLLQKRSQRFAHKGFI